MIKHIKHMKRKLVTIIVLELAILEVLIMFKFLTSTAFYSNAAILYGISLLMYMVISLLMYMVISLLYLNLFLLFG